MKLEKPYIFDFRRIMHEDVYHVEYCITDVCNRNCASCSHLAPLAKTPNFVSIEEFTRVVKIMRKVLPDIHTFWITGGEPTLHPDYLRLLAVLREVYYDTYAGIYSNGTTIKNHVRDKDFWRFVRDNGIVWAITPYEQDTGFFENVFEDNGCMNNLAIVQSGRRFFKLTNYALNQSVSHEKYEKCGWERSKINIRNGKIFNCPSSEFADLFNAYFNAELEIGDKDYLIVDNRLTRERIEKFKDAMPFCSYCDLSGRYTKPFENRLSKRHASEWTAAKEE